MFPPSVGYLKQDYALADGEIEPSNCGYLIWCDEQVGRGQCGLIHDNSCEKHQNYKSQWIMVHKLPESNSSRMYRSTKTKAMVYRNFEKKVIAKAYTQDKQ